MQIVLATSTRNPNLKQQFSTHLFHLHGNYVKYHNKLGTLRAQTLPTRTRIFHFNHQTQAVPQYGATCQSHPHTLWKYLPLKGKVRVDAWRERPRGRVVCRSWVSLSLCVCVDERVSALFKHNVTCNRSECRCSYPRPHKSQFRGITSSNAYVCVSCHFPASEWIFLWSARWEVLFETVLDRETCCRFFLIKTADERIQNVSCSFFSKFRV